MGKYAQIVMGPAGAGKSTYCSTMVRHCENIKRPVHAINLDPAAEAFDYPVSVDIKDLVTLEDVMSELNYGPNGGLVYCMEYLIENMEWFDDALDDFSDDYLLIDCPGQIELYSHVPVMRTLVDHLQKRGYYVAGVYLIDSQFISDASKFISGTLAALSAMVQLEIPHVNVLTKCDLLDKKTKKRELESFLEAEPHALLDRLNNGVGSSKYRKLNEAIVTLIEDFSLVSYVPLDPSDPDSIENVLYTIDMAIQFGEDEEVREPRDGPGDDGDEHEHDEDCDHDGDDEPGMSLDDMMAALNGQ